MLRLCGDSVAEHGGETFAFLTIVRGKEELFSKFRPRVLRAALLRVNSGQIYSGPPRIRILRDRTTWPFRTGRGGDKHDRRSDIKSAGCGFEHGRIVDKMPGASAGLQAVGL